MMTHLDEFTLLRYTARDLPEQELGLATRHLAECPRCEEALEQIRALDEELRELASAGAFEADGLAADDPFRTRPSPLPAPRRSPVSRSVAVEASERGLALREEILAALLRPEDARAALSRVSPARGADRFAVLYALQEAGRRSADSPFAARALATEALRWLREGAREVGEGSWESAERLVPGLVLRAQARLLLGISCLWTEEFSEAKRHFSVAYRSFGRGGADLMSLASVELAEAQRRGLAHDGASALVLARRAMKTFEEIGLDAYAARAMVAEGLALHALDRQEEAVASYRRALPAFEKFGLWSNYVGALNSAATSLIKLGRVDEARRDFARALRRISQDSHRYWLGYIRMGLAETLFAAGHFAEAAVSASRAARVFHEAGLRARALNARLLEIEGWARCGNAERARHRLELFCNDLEGDKALDPVISRRLADALSGADPSYAMLSSLRREVSGLIEERYRAG